MNHFQKEKYSRGLIKQLDRKGGLLTWCWPINIVTEVFSHLTCSVLLIITYIFYHSWLINAYSLSIFSYPTVTVRCCTFYHFPSFLYSQKLIVRSTYDEKKGSLVWSLALQDIKTGFSFFHRKPAKIVKRFVGHVLLPCDSHAWQVPKICNFTPLCPRLLRAVVKVSWRRIKWIWNQHTVN